MMNWFKNKNWGEFTLELFGCLFFILMILEIFDIGNILWGWL